MYTSTTMRPANPFRPNSVNAYKQLEAETSVFGADPHQLVSLLFDALQQSLAKTRAAMLVGDVTAKGVGIGKAVRILEEGLKAGLDVNKGGELALNLRTVYDICTFKLTEANLRNNVALVDEVIALVNPIADGWAQIRGHAAVSSYIS